MELKQLVWKEKGFMLDCASLGGDGDFELFFEGNSLEEVIRGCYKRAEVWRNKYYPEKIFIEEYECLEDALERVPEEDEVEMQLIKKRCSEIEADSE